MARNAGTVIENNFLRGLITEATGLNFPENAATDSLNVIFDPIGRVTRRKGIDIEDSADVISYTNQDGLIKEFIWRAVSGVGGVTFLVLQKGQEIYFYELTSDDTLSIGVSNITLDLRQYAAPGAGDFRNTPCTFASGAGFLYIAHPNCDPVIVRWNKDENNFEAARIVIRVRDHQGVEDQLGVAQEPTTLSDQHHYNLKNQGWSRNVRVGNVNNEIPGSTSDDTYYPLDWNDLN